MRDKGDTVAIIVVHLSVSMAVYALKFSDNSFWN